MSESSSVDYYETLQISPNADPDTIQRIFRVLAQRFHPDNQESGNAARFRELHEAYLVLNDPEKRAQYDARHQTLRQERWRFAASGATTENDFDLEQQLRCIVLEILYARRRSDAGSPALSTLELAQLTGRPREHLEFTIWYLNQKKFATRDDQSALTVTADGVDFIERSRSGNMTRRLSAIS